MDFEQSLYTTTRETLKHWDINCGTEIYRTNTVKIENARPKENYFTSLSILLVTDNGGSR